MTTVHTKILSQMKIWLRHIKFGSAVFLLHALSILCVMPDSGLDEAFGNETRQGVFVNWSYVYVIFLGVAFVLFEELESLSSTKKCGHKNSIKIRTS